MAKNHMKNIVIIMTLIMVVFAEANDSPKPISTDGFFGRFICYRNCYSKCKYLSANRQFYAACVANCQIENCNNTLSKDEDDCTASCVHSKSNIDNMDERGVNIIVNSCLETCKKN
uniref:Uncharacterized protein LOC113786179 n=1 Tax=Cicer arietinum TaxID=3827 RepID=A0A3Q7Y9Z7_CICAR|nr:uncharacterized protein LOC113786179 [Cicer arietinum]XP_027189256.1 uncharacterized protein LOC113786181 [Cicer arietinum]